MAFWNKKDSDDTDEVRISKEEYDELKQDSEKLLALKQAVVFGERMIISRDEYDKLKQDSEEATRLRKLEEAHQYNAADTINIELNQAREQCAYWEKQARIAQTQARDAQARATAFEEKYNQLYLNIEKQIEKERNEAAKQDAADLVELQKQLQKEADDKIEKSLKDANQKLARASEIDRNASQRLRKAQSIEKTNEEHEKALKAREDAYAAREQNVLAREQAISGKLASAQNVYRIMRERANAARGIVPKKSHDGYLVISSRQWLERYSAIVGGRRTQCSVAVWKSVVETPYDVALAADQIGTQVENDLRKVMSDIGCHCMVSDKDNGRYKNSMEKIENSREKNVLYKWDLVANFNSGFWLLEIYTTQSLTVPESRRPIKQRRN